MNNLADAFFSNINAVYRVGGYYYVTAGTDWVIYDDIFGQNIFYFITEGSCRVTVNGQTFSGNVGDWFFIPAGAQYSYHNINDKPFAKYWFHFDLYPATSTKGTFTSVYKLKCQDRPDIKNTFAKIAEISESRRPSDMLLTKSLVLSLLATYIDLSSKESEDFVEKIPKELMSLLLYIDGNLALPLSNDTLAAVLHMQTNHFIRYFKKYLGQTPQSYITAKRMDIAKRMLLDSDRPLSEIAEKTGFCDSAHFSKKFKSFYSISPGQYRKYAYKEKNV